MPSPRRLAIVGYRGNQYVVWIGETPRAIIPFSGPPCYVFDASARLTEWTRDTGDDHGLDHFYRPALMAPKMALDQVLAVTAASYEERGKGSIRESE